jgi:vitamin B12 transporter
MGYNRLRPFSLCLFAKIVLPLQQSLQNNTMRKIFILCSALFSFSLFAQQSLDSIEVSATRLPVKVYESGKSITIISQNQIQQLPVTTIDELFQYVGGININSRGGFGVQADIGMRGSTYSQVLVLVDNQRINDPLTGHYNNNVPVPMSEIERVEVIRGSAAASFGADAVGGIIHIKTKAYEALNNTDRYTSTTGNVGFGANNLTSTDLQIQQQFKKFGFTASMRSAASDGEEFVNPNFTNYQRGDSLNNTQFDLKTYSAAANYRSKKLKAYARVGVDARDFSAKYFYTLSSFDESTESTGAQWLQSAVSYDSDAGKTELTASYKKSTDEFIFNPNPLVASINNHEMQRVNATLSHQFRFKGINLNTGIQTDWQDITSNDRGDHKRLSNAAFILASKKIKKLSLNGGLRLEQSEQIGLQFIPQINAAYRNGALVFRSSIGRAIRQGDFTEQFNNNNTPLVSAGRSVGNPDLLPESSWNYDLGVDAFLGDLILSNTIFGRNSKDLIDFALTSGSDITNLTNLADTFNYLYAQNISEAFTWGNEFSLQYAKKFGANKLSVRVNYTFLQTNSPDSITSKYISNHPTHNLNGAINYAFYGFDVNVGGSLITRNAEDFPSADASIPTDYVVLNTRVSYTTDLMPLSVYIDVRNVLDTQYQEILGARMPGRWIIGGLKWNIRHNKVELPRRY